MTFTKDTSEESGTDELLRRLHDGPLQLVEFLAAGGYGRLRGADDYRDIANRAADELRALADEGAGDSDRGLATGIREVVSSSPLHDGLDIEARVDDVCDEIVGDVADSLLMATKEALNNVAKHAYASRVEVCCTRTPRGWVSIDIRDDGVGIERDQIACGDGIRKSIFRRVIGSGGRVEIDSGLDGTGTVVHLECPWNNARGVPQRRRRARQRLEEVAS